MRRTAMVAVVLIGIIVLGACGWWYYYTRTPQYSLVLLAKAVKSKDYETARYFVDDDRMADTISKSVVDAVTLQFTKKMEADQNPFSGLGVAVFQMMAPRMREMAKDQVKDSIRQALSGDDALTNGTGTQADLRPFSDLRIKECAVSGKTAEVLIEGIPQPNPFDLTQIRLRMARIPNSRSWRIEEIPDVGRAFAKILDGDA